MTVLNNADALRFGADPVARVYLGSSRVWPLPYDEVVMIDTPVLYLTMDDAAGTTIPATIGPDATYSGRTMEKVAGPSNAIPSAIDLEPGTNDYAYVPSQALLGPELVTLETWVYLEASTSDRGIISRSSSGALTDAYGFYIHGTDLIFHIGSYTTQRATTPMSSLPLNTWHHLVGTYDLQTIRLYLDGVEVGSYDYSSAITGGGNLRIGEYFAAPDTTDMRVSAVALYDKVLTPERIAAHYAAGVI